MAHKRMRIMTLSVESPSNKGSSHEDVVVGYFSGQNGLRVACLREKDRHLQEVVEATLNNALRRPFASIVPGMVLWKFSLETLQELDESLEGACIYCGEMGQSAEPDAVRYICDCCGKPGVYGATELAQRGMLF